jgi:hypothetical protein
MAYDSGRKMLKKDFLTKTPPTPKPRSVLSTTDRAGLFGFIADSAPPKAAKPCQ